jgi:hypothetical protein
MTGKLAIEVGGPDGHERILALALALALALVLNLIAS